jgi:hypothetical protein
LDRYDLYERCVQSPRLLVPLLCAIHKGVAAKEDEGHRATVLGEDFCGTALLSRTWVEMVEGGSAVAVEIDPEPLARARRSEGVRVVESDVMAIDAARNGGMDIVFAGNFSIGEIHDRAGLVAYLRVVRDRLSPCGVFVCDTYGGENAYALGHVDREHVGPDGTRINYRWEQREADPLTARVVNAMHFRVLRGDDVVQDERDAFVYDWRLWSVPELRDAMQEAGFVRTEVYAQEPDAVDNAGEAYAMPIEDASSLDEDFIVYIVGRTDAT